uniref:Fork-head domain-containing protein n=1 Tax=Bubo bubo TaxID=30461 RepID=A0A8C0FSW4_BUBBB
MATHPQLMDNVDYKTNPHVKPPYSYATLICMAMEASDKPRITLSAIYKWITNNCYFRHADPTWQVGDVETPCLFSLPAGLGRPFHSFQWARRAPVGVLDPAGSRAAPAAGGEGRASWAGHKRKQPSLQQVAKAPRLSSSALLSQGEQPELGLLEGDLDWEAIFDTSRNGEFSLFEGLELMPLNKPTKVNLDLTADGQHMDCAQRQEQVLTKSNQNNIGVLSGFSQVQPPPQFMLREEEKVSKFSTFAFLFVFL